jgi:hypothetical protein
MSDRGFFEGDDLAPYKVPDDGKCWWCGAAASTREHKFKHSDLKRLGGTAGGLIWGSGGIQKSIRSIRRSSEVRFGKNLCAECNNARSQPFDESYDRFVKYLWERGGKLWRKSYIDMREIYGIDWPVEVPNLARYVAKHIGCRMATDGYAVPREFSEFLDGGTLLPHVQMALFKDPELRKFHKQVHGRREWTLGLWIDPALGAVSPSRKRLTKYSSSLTVGYIGVFYRWDADFPDVDPFYLYDRARLYRRDKLPVM